MAGFQFNYFKEGIRLTMFFGIDVLAPVRRDTSSTHIMPRQDKAKAVRGVCKRRFMRNGNIRMAQVKTMYSDFGGFGVPRIGRETFSWSI